jgi:hypothetical protein
MSLSGTDPVTPTRPALHADLETAAEGFVTWLPQPKHCVKCPQDERQRNTAVDWGNIK